MLAILTWARGTGSRSPRRVSISSDGVHLHQSTRRNRSRLGSRGGAAGGGGASRGRGTSGRPPPRRSHEQAKPRARGRRRREPEWRPELHQHAGDEQPKRPERHPEHRGPTGQRSTPSSGDSTEPVPTTTAESGEGECCEAPVPTTTAESGEGESRGRESAERPGPLRAAPRSGALRKLRGTKAERNGKQEAVPHPSPIPIEMATDG